MSRYFQTLVKIHRPNIKYNSQNAAEFEGQRNTYPDSDHRMWSGAVRRPTAESTVAEGTAVDSTAAASTAAPYALGRVLGQVPILSRRPSGCRRSTVARSSLVVVRPWRVVWPCDVA